MSGCGMADSAELIVLTKAVDDYCAKHTIGRGPDRDEVGIRVLQLFRQGVIDPAVLSDSLEDILGRISPR
jgi:hypothetical protein